MMKLKIHAFTLLVTSLIIFSPMAEAQNKSAGIDLSLWKGIATQPSDSLQTTFFNLGLFTQMNQLKGVSLNGLSAITKKNVCGFQLGGLTNINGENSTGIIGSGITNVTGNNLRGIGISGLINITGHNTEALLISGFMNITGGNSSGTDMAGLMNVDCGQKNTGLKIAGLGNVLLSNLTGVAVGGLINITGGKTTGVQIAGLGNIARRLQGGQFSLINIADTATQGVQIGLVNYSRTSAKAKFGLANLNPDTRYQLMIFGGNTTKGNVGMRFKNHLFYTILGVGSHYLELSRKFSATAFYRTGLGYEVCKDFFLSGDIGYQHIENLDNKGVDDIPARMYALQARVNIEYQIKKKFGIFASGGYGITHYYDRSKIYEQKPIVELGIILF